MPGRCIRTLPVRFALRHSVSRGARIRRDSAHADFRRARVGSRRGRLIFRTSRQCASRCCRCQLPLRRGLSFGGLHNGIGAAAVLAVMTAPLPLRQPHVPDALHLGLVWSRRRTSEVVSARQMSRRCCSTTCIRDLNLHVVLAPGAAPGGVCVVIDIDGR